MISEYKLFEELNLKPRVIPDDFVLKLIYIGNLQFDDLNKEFNREVFFSIEEKHGEYKEYLKTYYPDFSTHKLRTGTVYKPKSKTKEPKAQLHLNGNIKALVSNSNFNKKGLISYLSNSLFPLKRLQNISDLDLDQPFYLTKTKENVHVAIPNTLISRYFYHVNNFVYDYLYRDYIKDVYEGVADIEGNKVLCVRTLPPSLYGEIEHIGHYFFTSGQPSGYKMLIDSLNVFHRDMLNARRTISAYPKDIVFKIPFEKEVEFTLEGDFIEGNKFLANNISHVKAIADEHSIFNITNYYIFYMDDFQENIQTNTKLKNSIKRHVYDIKNSVVDMYKGNKNDTVNYFNDTPIINTISYKTLDYLGIKLREGNQDFNLIQNNTQVNSKKTLLSKDDDHFLKVNKNINKTRLDTCVLKIGDYFGGPYSNIDYAFNTTDKYRYIAKAVIVKFLYDGNEYVLLNFGSNFLLCIIQNFGEAFRYKNDARLIKFIAYAFHHFRFNWEVVTGNYLKKTCNKKMADEIFNDFNIKVLTPINFADSFEEPYKGLDDLIKSRLKFHSF